MNTFDSVSLGILWDRLISISDEVVSTLIRTSFSINVRECYDLSCILFDAEGYPLSQGTYSVPSFTGTAGPTIAHMLRRFPPNELEEGDVILTNDPWMGSGHLFDINVMRPVFHKGKLSGFTMSITHLPDIGGVGNSSHAVEIYEEGLWLPICKLMRRGKLDSTIMEIVQRNVRASQLVIGDFMANISCNEVGGRLLIEFMEEYGISDLSPLSKAIRDQSEATMREKLRTIPDGDYSNSLQIEGVDTPVTLACKIKKRNDEIEIDFTGTGDAIRAAINVPFCYTRAWACYAVKCLTCPDTPNNEGQVRPIRITAPEGCILNAMPPRAVAGRHSVGHFVVPLIFGALEKALPDRIQADVGMMNIFNIYGRHKEGREIASLFYLAGGFGALNGLDGAPTMPAPSNMGVVPTEMWEVMTSMTVEKRELLPDSGGAGEFRGGAGQEAVLRNDTGNLLTISFMGQRTEFPARGFHGGKPGQLRRYHINGKVAHAKGRYVLKPGDVVTIGEAGGGGFGDPRKRPVAVVLDDIERGFVSVEGALRDFGVRIDPQTGAGSRA